MSSETILYDLASRSGRGWSHNVWKTRALLAYKEIPYTTHFIEFPDIPAVLSPKIPARTSGLKQYTVPTLEWRGQAINDSLTIAQHICSAVPSPPLPLDLARIAHFSDAIEVPLATQIRAVWVPRVPRNLLSERAAAFFHEDRAKRWGKTVDDIEAEGDGKGEAPWIAVEPTMRAWADMLKENPEGPFFDGKEPTYLDLHAAAELEGYRSVDPEIYDRLVAFDGVFVRFAEACAPWFQKGT